MSCFAHSNILFCFIGAICLNSFVGSHETNMEKELLLTYQEKLAFDKFKSQVYESVSKSNNFLKTDLFLLRFLRSKNIDVNRAVKDMHECLEWRRKNKIDTILDEDWSDMIVEHPYRTDVVDLQGRPVAVGAIGGTWNVRRSVIQGKVPRLSRYAFKIIEEVFNKTYEANKIHPNVTQFSVIGSLEGFNMFQQACPLCLTTYLQLLSTYNRYYPNFAHSIIAINTPPTFSVALDLIRPMLTKEMSQTLKIYSYNKKQWKPALDKEVSEDQLPAEFGGTRPDENDE